MIDSAPTGKFLFGPFELDTGSGELRKRGRKVRVPEQAIEILSMLVDRPAQLVTREEIRRRLWPNGTVVEFESGINAAIKKLRLALGDAAENPRYVETIPRRGYRLIIPIERQQSTPPAAPPDQASVFEIRPGSLTGRRIGHYRVLNIIGGGAMGLVYQAEDLKLNRRVALKFLPEELTKAPLAIERLRREARAASGLNHPNICTVHAIEEEAGHPFIVMELLEGSTLRDRIARAALSTEETLDFTIQITEALQAAHEQGIIHRDIKPANIFITIRQQVKILDFGVAKLLRYSGIPDSQDVLVAGAGSSVEHPTPADLTKTGVAMGTAAYMSPEQVRGEELDCRTDLFSFGLVLYEMVTGRQAFEQATVTLLHDAILNRSPVPVRQLKPGTPPGVVQIIDKAIQKDRQCRYQSAAQIKNDLVRLSRHASALSRRDLRSFAGTAAFVRNRKPVLALLLIIGALVAAGGLAIYRSLVLGKSIKLENVKFTRLTDSGRAVTAAISPDGRYVVYTLKSGGGNALWLRSVAAQSQVQILAPDAVNFDGLTFSPDTKDVYFVRSDKSDPGIKNLYRMPLLGGVQRLLIRDIDSPVSFSPDGQQFVFTRGIPTQNSTEVRIASADGSKNRLLATRRHCFAGYEPGATWSPDGQTIAVSTQRDGTGTGYSLDFISFSDGRIRELYSSPYSIGRALWLRDGRNLLVSLAEQSGKGQLWTITYPEGRARRITNDLSDYDISSGGLTRDANTLSLVLWNTRSNLWTMTGLDWARAKQITSGELAMIEVSDAGKGKLLAISSDRALWLIDRDTHQRQSFLDAHGYYSLNVCNASVVVSSVERGVNTLFRIDMGGAHSLKLASGDVSASTCSPDGRLIYFVHQGAPQKIFGIPFEGGTAREIARVPGDGLIAPVSISRDGKLLAYPYERFTPVPVIKFAIISTSGTTVNTLNAPAGVYGLSILRWSPDGSSLQFLLTLNDATNIWEQPTKGGAAKQLTNFGSGRIFDFNWTQDGKDLLLARGEITSDVVLISGLQ
jgi:serine/threonine protein kinase/Tol biopolymer transport system component